MMRAVGSLGSGNSLSIAHLPESGMPFTEPESGGKHSGMQIACQIHETKKRKIERVDRFYVGERFCVKRYLQNLGDYVTLAGGFQKPVWLVTPKIVLESNLDEVASVTVAVADHFDGILVGDYGLGRRLRGKSRLIYDGTVMNRAIARRIVDLLEVEQIRLLTPGLDIIESVGEIVPLEVMVHGQIPLSATPRCLIRAHLDCDKCERELEVTGGPVPITLRGNVLYASRPIQAFGLIQRLNELGVAMGVIEAMNLEDEEVDRLVDVYKERTPVPDQGVSGLYFGSERSGFISSRWMDILRLTVEKEGR